MKALSIIGIVLSVTGVLTCIYIIGNSHCDCSYNYIGFSVAENAVSGAMAAMLLFVFFLVFSIVATASAFSKKNSLAGFSSPAQQVSSFRQNYPQYPPYPDQNQTYNQSPFPNQNPYSNQQVQKNNSTNPPHNPWAPKQ